MEVHDLKVAAAECLVVANLQLKENPTASSVVKTRHGIVDGKRVLVTVEVGDIEDDRWESN